MALRITTSAKTIRRFWMRLKAIRPIPFLIWVVDPAEINEAGADRVRTIFRSYLRLGSLPVEKIAT